MGATWPRPTRSASASSCRPRRAARRSSTSTRASPAPRRWPTSRPAAGRLRHRLPRRPHQPRARPTSLCFRDYVLAYTNAAHVVADDFQDTEDLDGLFSGFDAERAPTTARPGRYEGVEPVQPPASGARDPRRSGRSTERGGADACAIRATTRRSQHPRCVFQVLRRHFARYTPEMVEAICGISRRTTSGRWPRRSRATRGATAPARSATPSAGPSTRPASRSSAPPRSCNCCWATSAGRAAASWRCAATRRSRAAPTSRPSTTCCPATCRCRATGRSTTLAGRLSRRRASPTGWWANMPSYIV